MLEKTDIFAKIFDDVIHYKRITGEQLAAALGVTPQGISKTRTGDTGPSGRLLAKMKEVYPDINAEFLLTGEGDVSLPRNELDTEPTIQLHEDKLDIIISLLREMLNKDDNPTHNLNIFQIYPESRYIIQEKSGHGKIEIISVLGKDLSSIQLKLMYGTWLNEREKNLKNG